MKDYTFYIAAAYLLTAVVLAGVTFGSFLSWRRASRKAAGEPDA